MIGVCCNEADREIAEEFFQLFKTPWEFARAERAYEGLVCCGGAARVGRARCVLHYDVTSHPSAGAREIPFPGKLNFYAGPKVEHYRMAAGKGEVSAWMGYDVFAEVKFLLTSGQPAANAQDLTLERHIELMRGLLAEHAGPLLEIPPIPAGFDLVACMTHDLDHVNVRDHFLDHTAAGFLGRALAGSVARWAKGRLSGRGVMRNWASAACYPLVHAGLARDFWNNFDRYSELEQDARSTYYVIPRKGDPGKPLNGAPRPKRAASYELGQVAERLRRLASQGCEVGVHGIDAWCDEGRGRLERERVAGEVGGDAEGVRMHWLYFDAQSPLKLDKAGFSYDSTFGYNNTVGFRAGTAQVFRPFGVERLLELPLVAMDTALFYPDYLDLGPSEARKLLQGVIESVRSQGGVFTANWHDRSISPERQWDGAYKDMLADLRRHVTWFPCAREAVDWFRTRRSARIEEERVPGGVRARVRCEKSADSPGLRMRLIRNAHPGGGTVFEESVVTQDCVLDFST